MRMVEDARMVIVPMFRIGTKVNGFATVTLSGSPAWRVPWRAMQTVVCCAPSLNSLEALFAPCCCSVWQPLAPVGVPVGQSGARVVVDSAQRAVSFATWFAWIQ